MNFITKYGVRSEQFYSWPEMLEKHRVALEQNSERPIKTLCLFKIFLHDWSSQADSGFLKNFLLEGKKLTTIAIDNYHIQTLVPGYSPQDVTVETIIFYISTLQYLVRES